MPVREVREYNLNMARYYAWSNLTSYVRAAFRRHFLPAHRYTYRYVPPTVHTHYQLTPYHEWTSNRVRDRSQVKWAIISLTFLSTCLSVFWYQVLHDDDLGYFYHTNFPILCKLVEAITQDTITATKPFFDIVPQNRYQITQVYPRLWALVTQKEKRREEHDRKAMALKKEVEEYDRTHK